MGEEAKEVGREVEVVSEGVWIDVGRRMAEGLCKSLGKEVGKELRNEVEDNQER